MGSEMCIRDRPKEPLSVSTEQAIATHFASSTSLSDLRFLFILLVGFAGFFRIDEIRKIALRDVSIHSDHVCLCTSAQKRPVSGRPHCFSC